MNDIVTIGAVRLLAHYYENTFPYGSSLIKDLETEHCKTWNRTLYRNLKILGLKTKNEQIEFLNKLFGQDITSRKYLKVGEIRALVVAVEVDKGAMQSLVTLKSKNNGEHDTRTTTGDDSNQSISKNEITE